MNDDKMTAEQAWAEVDRLDAEIGKARIRARQIENDATAAEHEAFWRARAIGPRPVKPLPESACRHRACDGSGRTATGDGKFQLCMCAVPS